MAKKNRLGRRRVAHGRKPEKETTRRAADAALQLAAIVEASDDAIFRKTLDGIIVSWNRGAEKMYGYAAEEMLGRPISILVPPDCPDELPEILERIQHGESVDQYDTVRIRKDGRLIHVSLTVSPVHDATGRLLGACGISRDVTERKLAEAQLKNANANLQQKNREMVDFVQTVSHDLKSPLVTIGGVLGLLKEELQEERLVAAGELIATAEETVVGMRDMIDDLLKLSRIGTVAIDLQPVGLSEVAEELVRKHAPELEDKHTDVSLELNEDQPTVLADLNRLVEVLDNMIVNALKYACDGPEPRITIGSETVGREVRLFVKDNGPGIGREHHEKIFGLFQRLDDSKEGTGVGLAIVKRIMEVHGGRVWVESAIGEGATFWLAFPAAVGEAAMSLSAQGAGVHDA